MAKNVSAFGIEASELALSLLGWEVQDFRARVITEQHKPGGDCFHKLAVSGVFRFNDDAWTDCFSVSRDYPSRPVLVLSSPVLSAWPAITALYIEKPKKGRPARVAENDWFINSYRQIDHSDLRIELTAYDSIESNSRMSYIPIDVKPVPIELVDESTPSSVRLTFDHTDAFTHQADGEDASKRYGQIRVSGRATFGSPDQILEDWVTTWRYPITKTPSVLDKAPFVRPTWRVPDSESTRI